MKKWGNRGSCRISATNYSAKHRWLQEGLMRSMSQPKSTDCTGSSSYLLLLKESVHKWPIIRIFVIYLKYTGKEHNMYAYGNSYNIWSMKRSFHRLPNSIRQVTKWKIAWCVLNCLKCLKTEILHFGGLLPSIKSPKYSPTLSCL